MGDGVKIQLKSITRGKFNERKSAAESVVACGGSENNFTFHKHKMW